MSTKGSYDFAAKEAVYRRYPDLASLEFAANDAREARDAMKGHDTAAENWYADDVSTILSEINRRRNGE